MPHLRIEAFLTKRSKSVYVKLDGPHRILSRDRFPAL